MPNPYTQEFQSAAERASEFLRGTLAQIRTDRATPALVEDIAVEAYGSFQPLKALASVSVADARSLVVQAWDAQLGPAIGKAIAASPIGVNPTVEGGVVRITLPTLTAERRELLTRTITEKREEARIAVRGARDEAMKRIRTARKDGDLSEDQARAAEKELETAVGSATEGVDTLAERKVAELHA